MQAYKIGKVVSYYPKTKMAIIKLDANLHKGDLIRIKDTDQTVAEEKVNQMQIGHKKVDKAEKGKIVGVKINQQLTKSAQVFLLQN